MRCGILGFKFSDVTGAADLDFGSDGHFNDLEDAVNPLQKDDPPFVLQEVRTVNLRSVSTARLMTTSMVLTTEFSSCNCENLVQGGLQFTNTAPDFSTGMIVEVFLDVISAVGGWARHGFRAFGDVRDVRRHFGGRGSRGRRGSAKHWSVYARRQGTCI